MAAYTQRITLDVGGNYLPFYKYMKQGDGESAYLVVTVTANGQQLIPAAGDTAYIRVVKPDHTEVVNDASINADGSITARITTAMTAAAGIAKADICIVGASEDVLSTATFFLDIDASPSSSATSTNEFLDLIRIVKEGKELLGDYETALAQLEAIGENAEAWAVGKRGGADVSDEDETYHNNAKYFMEQAKATAEAIKIEYTIDSELSTDSQNPVQNRVIAAALREMRGAIDDLNYTAIAVSGFSVSPNQAEMGSSVTTVSLTWALNRAASEARLDGEVIALTGTSGTISRSGLSLTANKTWTLTATDERGATASRSASLSFLNRIYWGAAAEPETLGSAFVLSLASSALASSRGRTITLSAGTGQYIWYCVPARLGTPAFKVGGFDGGFTKVATFQHTNASGYTEAYDVYRSDNANLGNTSVVIS